MEEANPTTTTHSSTKRLMHAWKNTRSVIMALAIALAIRYFIAQPFLVSGASMEPSLHNGNFLIVDEISYRFKNPSRGEIIVFHYPGQEDEYFVKRIIALPGETLTVEGNIVRIASPEKEEITLTEPYIKPDLRPGVHKEMTLASDEYFVMGDNRGNSFDSRNWGPLHRTGITGIARFRVFPFSQFGSLPPHMY